MLRINGYINYRNYPILIVENLSPIDKCTIVATIKVDKEFTS